VVFNFAASGPLFQQIEMGAPVDVFASADQKSMDQAHGKKLIEPETRKDFASNGLVLIIPKEAKFQVRSLDDLKGKEVTRVSLGNPETVPAGRYAKEALVNEGLWDDLAPKYIMGNTVRQVLDYVSRGEVDVGFVFATDAAVAKEKVAVVLTLGKHAPILYPIGVVAASARKDLAGRFVEFVLSETGRQILAHYGFGKP
jgi:molybdate transport system substrate-binding protein